MAHHENLPLDPQLAAPNVAPVQPDQTLGYAIMAGARNKVVVRNSEGEGFVETSFDDKPVPVDGLLRGKFEEAQPGSAPYFMASMGGEEKVRGFYTHMKVEMADGSAYLIERTSPPSVESARDQTFNIVGMSANGRDVTKAVPLSSEALRGLILKKGEPLTIGGQVAVGGDIQGVAAYKLPEIDEAGDTVMPPTDPIAAKRGVFDMDPQVERAIEVSRQEILVARAAGSAVVHEAVTVSENVTAPAASAAQEQLPAAEADKQDEPTDEDVLRVVGHALQAAAGHDPMRDLRLKALLREAPNAPYSLDDAKQLLRSFETLKRKDLAEGRVPRSALDLAHLYQQTLARQESLDPAQRRTDFEDFKRRAHLIRDMANLRLLHDA